MSDLFMMASADPVGEARQEATSAVRKILAPQFAFCAQASTYEEFEDRLSLIANRVENAVEVATRQDTTLFPIVHRAVIESWNTDFDGVLRARAIEIQREAAAKVATNWEQVDSDWNAAYWAGAAANARAQQETEQRLYALKGKRVTVVKGRKVPIGIEGVVFWSGPGKYGWRLGLNTDAGETVWIDASNVEEVAGEIAVTGKVATNGPDDLIIWPELRRKKVDEHGNEIENPDDELINWPAPKRPKHAKVAYTIVRESPLGPGGIVTREQHAQAEHAAWKNGQAYTFINERMGLHAIVIGLDAFSDFERDYPGYELGSVINDPRMAQPKGQTPTTTEFQRGGSKTAYQTGESWGGPHWHIYWQGEYGDGYVWAVYADEDHYYGGGDPDFEGGPVSDIEDARAEVKSYLDSLGLPMREDSHGVSTMGSRQVRADWRVVNSETGHIDETGYKTKPEAEGQVFGEGYTVQYVDPREAEDQPGDVIEEPDDHVTKSTKASLKRISMTAQEADEQVAKAPPEFQSRLAALKPYLIYGPGYNRNVAENFHYAVRFLGSQNTHAEVYLAKAESHAEYQRTGVWVNPWDGQASLNLKASWQPIGDDAWASSMGEHLATVVRVGQRFQWSTAVGTDEYEGEEGTLRAAQASAVASITSLGGTPPWLKDKNDDSDDAKKPASDGGTDGESEPEADTSDGDTPGQDGEADPENPTDPNAGPPDAPQQDAPSLDPSVMDVGQTSSMAYTLADGTTGSIEVTFVREENGVYYFSGPTGEFGVGNSNNSWTDANNNTFSFSGASPTKQNPDTTNASETPVDKDDSKVDFPPKQDSEKDDDEK